jgi:hypothetical protein
MNRDRRAALCASPDIAQVRADRIKLKRLELTVDLSS